MGRLRILAGVYAIGGATGWLCALLGVPLPWIVGALFSTGLLSARFGAPPVSAVHRWAGQLVIAGAVGLNLTPEALSAIIANIGPMLISAFATIGFAIGSASLLIRTRRIDRATALFASLPGGPIEMAGLANQYGGNGGIVAFTQTVRIAAIVVLIPPLLLALGIEAVDLGRRPVPFEPLGVLLVLATGLLCGLVCLKFRIANPFFIGPLLGVGALAMLEAPVAQFPGPVLAAAQVAIGVTLGAMFNRMTIIAAGRFVSYALIIGAALLALAFGLGALQSIALDASFPMLVLANAPGGTPEMAITASSMHLDAALVTAFHIVRILVIIPAAALIFRLYARLDRLTTALRR